jgi:catechol 2,3-dioxygenase-like lactoylglutathione lyase family enzyme
LIQHVTRRIRSSQLDDCIAFYRILGFQPVEVPPGIAGRAVWLECSLDPDSAGPSQVHLMPAPDAEPEQGHFALVAHDYAATLDRLRRAGHEVDPRREHWGSPRAYVRDPAGNLVELMERPPARGRPGRRQ